MQRPKWPDEGQFPEYSGIPTFFRQPTETANADIACFGVPCDLGCTNRPGARMGPRAVREASTSIRPYHFLWKRYIFDDLRVRDAGDAPVANDLRETHRGLRKFAHGFRNFIAVGGDHSMTLPLLRAARDRWGNLAVVQFDAHLDDGSGFPPVYHDHGTWVFDAKREGLFSDIYQIGIRGQGYAQPSTSNAVVLWGSDCDSDAIEHIASGLRDKPVYVTVDIDSVDPAFAPGTGCPEVGGLTSAQLITLLRALKGINMVSADVMEVAPAYDHAGITSWLAANIMFELLHLFPCRKQ